MALSHVARTNPIKVENGDELVSRLASLSFAVILLSYPQNAINIANQHCCDSSEYFAVDNYA